MCSNVRISISWDGAERIVLLRKEEGITTRWVTYSIHYTDMAKTLGSVKLSYKCR